MARTKKKRYHKNPQTPAKKRLKAKLAKQKDPTDQIQICTACKYVGPRLKAQPNKMGWKSVCARCLAHFK